MVPEQIRFSDHTIYHISLPGIGRPQEPAQVAFRHAVFSALLYFYEWRLKHGYRNACPVMDGLFL